MITVLLDAFCWSGECSGTWHNPARCTRRHASRATYMADRIRQLKQAEWAARQEKNR